jgi:hypothetical protein
VVSATNPDSFTNQLSGQVLDKKSHILASVLIVLANSFLRREIEPTLPGVIIQVLAMEEPSQIKDIDLSTCLF